MEQKKISISAQLKQLREAKHITTKELTKTGITLNALQLYEGSRNKMPSLDGLIKIADYFSISIDFLLLWNECFYPKSIKLLSLGKQIDEMDELKRFQIDRTCKTLMGDKDIEVSKIKLDNDNLELGSSFNENLKMIREKKDLSQTELAKRVSVLQNSISAYERKTTPPADRLISLSQCLDVSVNALATGKTLYYKFRNEDFGKILLKADAVLDLKDKEILIELMERTIK